MHHQIEKCLQVNYGLNVRTITAVDLDSTPQPGYRIHTEDGEWLIKPIADYRPAAAFAAAAKFQRMLWDAGVPVARLVPTLDGELVCRMPFGDATLQSWLKGRHGQSGSTADCRATIAAHARVLNMGKNYCGRAFASLTCKGKESLWFDGRHDWTRMLAALEKAVAVHSSCNLQSEADQLANDANNLCNVVAWDALPQGLMHGDPGPDNIIFVNDSPHLIDFDDARIGFRIWDSARAVGEYAVEAQSNAGEVFARFDMQLLAEMIGEGCGLPDAQKAEQDAWEPMVRLSVVSALFGRINLDWELNGLDPPKLIEDAVALRTLISAANEALRVELVW